MPYKELEWKSFFELTLIAERAAHLYYRELENTRLIMYAAGNWAKGTTPKKLMPLPTDNMKPAPNQPTPEQAISIRDNLLKYMPKKTA